MPQYPLTPFPPQGRGRTVIVGADNPRFVHLPLVVGYPGGVVKLLRGQPAVLDRLSCNQRLMLCDMEPNEPHFVATNRRGRLSLVPAERRILAGLLENRLYAATYAPPTWDADMWDSPDVVAREDVRRELCYLQDAEAEGWELVENNGYELLIDTRRPDEVLRRRDLP